MQGSAGHIEFTGAPDPIRMMQMMNSMHPDELNSVMERMKTMNTKTESDPTSQEGIREHWKMLKKDEAKLQKMKKQGMSYITTTQSWDVKKFLHNSSFDPSTYNPISIMDLGLGTTHRGCVLFGRVADSGGFWSISSGAFLIEDLSGSVMEVAVYNYPKETFSRDFSPGRELCIIEPYYKLRADGSVGIRVDYPSEVCDYPLPTNSEDWKNLGNWCIKHSPDLALACYDSGLRAPNKAVLEHLLQTKKGHKPGKNLEQEALGLMLQVSKLLTNLSICEFNMSHYHLSLLYALIAFGLGLDTTKAAFWVTKALHSSGLEDEGRQFAAWFCRHDRSNSALQNEWNLTTQEISMLDGGASFIQGTTPSNLAQATEEIMKVACREESNEDWLLMKQRGDDHFKKGEIYEASKCYVSSLASCPFLVTMFGNASFLISNKGAALLNIDNTPIDSINGAVSMLSAALLNSYGNGRAWVRVARFLELQGRDNDATLFLEDSVTCIKKQKFKLSFLENDCHSSNCVKIIESELDQKKLRSTRRSRIKTINPESTEQQLKERGKADKKSGRSLEELDEEIMASEGVYNMHKMMTMIGDGAKVGEVKQYAGPTIDRIIHAYHTDYLQSVGVPDGLDKSYVQKVLYWSYVRYRTDPWVRAMGWRMTWSKQEGSTGELGKLLTDSDDILKRWHGTYPLKVIRENPSKYAKVGAIIDIRSIKPPTSYESRIRSNFVNCPHRNEVFFQGTTHLAIGFNDLNSLINCIWMEANQQEYQGKPSRFVGLEMNPFNVAKTLVVAEMISNSEIPLEEILQVWYSTVWSQQALASFKACAQVVLTKGELGLAPHRDDLTCSGFSARNVSNEKVASYLNHWLSVKSISYKEARRLWLENTMRQNSKAFQQISSCKRRGDMLAIIQYCLTGEVFGSKTFQPHGLNAVGSLTFWQCPEGSPPLEEESMFNAFAIEDLMTVYQEDSSKNIVQVFEAKAMNALSNLRSKLLSDTVSIELYVGVLKPLTEPDGHGLVSFITNIIKPYTIGWSNVIDYMELGNLHDLGRAISSHGEVAHYGYSMNWPTETFGANIMDYEMFRNYKAANYILDMALGENFGGMNPDKTNIRKALMTSVGACDLFVCPDHDTPLNSTSYIASNLTREQWLEYFVYKAGGTKEVGKCFDSSSKYRFQPTNCGFNTPGGPVGYIIPSPLHRLSTQIYLGWTYDPKLKLAEGVLPPTEFDMHLLDSIMGDLGMSS